MESIVLNRLASGPVQSYTERHLAMLASWQMRVSTRTHPNSQPQTAATRFQRTGRYLCIFFFLSLCFFFAGVLVGVGEGVPEGSGVGDGRTRG